MSKRKINKGYTLVELSVALSIGAIIAVMLSIVLINANNLFENNNFAMDKFSEFEDFKNEVCAVCEKYEGLDYAVEISGSGESLLFKKGSETAVLELSGGEFKENSSLIKSFSTISAVKIEGVNSLILVNVNFSNQSNLRFII